MPPLERWSDKIKYVRLKERHVLTWATNGKLYKLYPRNCGEFFYIIRDNGINYTLSSPPISSFEPAMFFEKVLVTDRKL